MATLPPTLAQDFVLGVALVIASILLYADTLEQLVTLARQCCAHRVSLWHERIGACTVEPSKDVAAAESTPLMRSGGGEGDDSSDSDCDQLDAAAINADRALPNHVRHTAGLGRLESGKL